MHTPRYSKTVDFWQAWGAIATTLATAVGMVLLIFTFINENRAEIRDTRTTINSAIQDLRVEIRGNRLDLDNDLEIIDARLEQRLNHLDAVFTQNLIQLNGIIERAAAQAHIHTNGLIAASGPAEDR